MCAFWVGKQGTALGQPTPSDTSQASVQGQDPGDDGDGGQKQERLACVNGTCLMTREWTNETAQVCQGKKAGDPCGKRRMCENDADCGEGYLCVDGICRPDPNAKFKCTTDENCPEGLVCRGGKCVKPTVECVTDADCPEGQNCVDGKCVDVSIGDCPRGNYYTSTTGCDEGYVYFPGKKRCECSAWCLTVGYEADCKTPKGGGGGGDDMGEFQFPPGLKEYYDMMMARGKELLGMPVGYTDEMINKMYGKDFEAIRGQEAAQREATSRILSREGALGTGQATQAFTNIGAGTEQNIANALRDIFIESEKQKKTDILNYTEMAQNLFAGGQNYWMLQEAANAARRGDMFKSLELLLKYYGIGVAGYGG